VPRSFLVKIPGRTLLEHYVSKRVGRKIVREEGGEALERPRLRNNTKMPPFVLKVAGWGRTRHASKTHLKGTLHQEPRVKSEDLFLREIPISEKMPIPF